MYTYIHTYIVYPSVYLFLISSCFQSSALTLFRSLNNLPNYSPLPSSLCISNNFFLHIKLITRCPEWSSAHWENVTHSCLSRPSQVRMMWQQSFLTLTHPPITQAYMIGITISWSEGVLKEDVPVNLELLQQW